MSESRTVARRSSCADRGRSAQRAPHTCSGMLSGRATCRTDATDLPTRHRRCRRRRGSSAPTVSGSIRSRTRLANRAQRRALRVMYRTCALCDTPFEHTQAHHVTYYGLQQGLTDIDNMVPFVFGGIITLSTKAAGHSTSQPIAPSRSPDQTARPAFMARPESRAASTGPRRDESVAVCGRLGAMGANNQPDSVFEGSLPEMYETYLVPVIFEP